MKNATLRQLKVFEAVARLLSFSRAAEELHLTQPAVSTQVRKLEEHAGNLLFEQFGKKVLLTPAGIELLLISRNIIQQFEAAENAMTQFSCVSGGKLNVGVTTRDRKHSVSTFAGHACRIAPKSRLSGYSQMSLVGSTCW